MRRPSAAVCTRRRSRIRSAAGAAAGAAMTTGAATAATAAIVATAATGATVIAARAARTGEMMTGVTGAAGAGPGRTEGGRRSESEDAQIDKKVKKGRPGDGESFLL